MNTQYDQLDSIMIDEFPSMSIDVDVDIQYDLSIESEWYLQEWFSFKLNDNE